MKKLQSLGSFLILILALATLAFAAIPSTSIACRIITPSGSYGSGVILPDGFVLTAAHVLSDSVEGHTIKVPFPQVIFDDRTRKTARLERFDRQRDLALLSTKHQFTGVSLGEMPVKGASIWVIGSSAGCHNSLKRGIVSNIEEGNLFIDAIVNHGDSGGPVLNDDGELVGLTKAIRLNYQSYGALYTYGMAIPVSVIKDFLEGR